MAVFFCTHESKLERIPEIRPVGKFFRNVCYGGKTLHKKLPGGGADLRVPLFRMNKNMLGMSGVLIFAISLFHNH